jgi:hypothetical protein
MAGITWSVKWCPSHLCPLVQIAEDLSVRFDEPQVVRHIRL